MKVCMEKYGKDYFESNVMDPPYVDRFGYFQSSLPITLHVSMFRSTLENLANDE